MEVLAPGWLRQLTNEWTCGICQDLVVMAHALPCSHCFCQECLSEWLRRCASNGLEPSCPNCRQPVSTAPAPVRMLDNTIDKFAAQVLSQAEQLERKSRVARAASSGGAEWPQLWGTIGDGLGRDPAVHSDWSPHHQRRGLRQQRRQRQRQRRRVQSAGAALEGSRGPAVDDADDHDGGGGGDDDDAGEFHRHRHRHMHGHDREEGRRNPEDEDEDEVEATPGQAYGRLPRDGEGGTEGASPGGGGGGDAGHHPTGALAVGVVPPSSSLKCTFVRVLLHLW